MPDTVRTLSALLNSLFANGQSAGSITPQDMRDLIVSLSPPYGGLFFSSAAATTIVTPGTMVKALGTTALTNARGMAMPSNNRLTYTGVPDRHFHIVLSTAFTTAGTNDNLSIAVAMNDVVLDHSKLTRFAATGMDQGSTASHADVTLSTGDYIEAFVTNEDESENVTIEQGYLFAMGIII